MKYFTGEDVRLWDRLEVWSGCRGLVVLSVDDDAYTARFPKAQWAYLGSGVMLDTEQAGLMHYSETSEDMRLIARGIEPPPQEWADLRRVQLARTPGEWRHGNGESVRTGSVNPHGQICTGHRGVRGIDHLQYAYRTECGHCGNVYGTNGSDMHERRCPGCQEGVPGIPF
jgi:hypothetical protein